MGRELIAPRLFFVAPSLGLALALTACGGPRVAAPAPTARAEPPPRSEARAARVRVRVLRVLVGEERTPGQARERAAMLARTARADDFSELAARYGDGDEPRRSQLASAGLEITAEAPAIVPPRVRDAALALEVREVSQPVETDDGLWVLQRVD